MWLYSELTVESPSGAVDVVICRAARCLQGIPVIHHLGGVVGEPFPEADAAELDLTQELIFEASFLPHADCQGAIGQVTKSGRDLKILTGKIVKVTVHSYYLIV